LRIAAPPVAASLPCDTCQTDPIDPDLALVNTAWSGLPESVRASIMMLVRAASGGAR
jgi:hypothetical protein